jgi:formylglycine-generating enzyme required for sulfatase activity
MKQNALLLSVLMILLAGCQPAAQGGAVPVYETGVDPESWVLVPAGEFLYGQHEHPTMLDYDYEMMVTDVTNGQFAEYLNVALDAGWLEIDDQAVVGYFPGDEFHGYKHEEEIPEGDYLHFPLDDPGLRLTFDGKYFSFLPEYEDHPVVLVSWFGANAYCRYYGYRLPLEMEWEKAARGTDNRPYPWGEGIERNQANYYSSHDIFEKIAGKSDTTPVGFFNGSTYGDYKTEDQASPYGLYDMAGNVWQWVGDDYPDQHYRYMRGGSKESYAYNLRIWTRNSAGPTFYSPSVGFRCVREP